MKILQMAIGCHAALTNNIFNQVTKCIVRTTPTGTIGEIPSNIPTVGPSIPTINPGTKIVPLTPPIALPTLSEIELPATINNPRTSILAPVVTTTTVALPTTDPVIVIQQVPSITTLKTTTIPSITTTTTAASAPTIIRDKVSEISQFCQQFVGQNGILPANGSQFKNGVATCSSTPMGLLPNADNMVSTMIMSPAYGSTINAGINNTVKLQTNNLDEGFFDDPNTKYYVSPSTLSSEGKIQGHQHISVEFLGNAQQPPDALKFSFFKGINEIALDSEKKELSAVIPANTLKVAGLYRICSMSGSFGHQPVLSPVLVRGPMDDCIRVSVAL